MKNMNFINIINTIHPYLFASYTKDRMLFQKCKNFKYYCDYDNLILFYFRKYRCKNLVCQEFGEEPILGWYGFTVPSQNWFFTF